MEQLTLEGFARTILQAGYTLETGPKLLWREIIRFAMKETGGNQCEAAKIAGIHRNTVGRALKECGLPTKRKHWRGRSPKKPSAAVPWSRSERFA